MAAATKLTNPLKWHGGKGYLAAKIVALMPPHRHYVEPFAGGLSVLLERDPNNKRLWWGESSDQAGVSEVVNDLNCELTDFWRVLQGADTFPRFQRILDVMPLSRVEFDDAQKNRGPLLDIVDRAVNFFVRCRQSRAGTFKSFTSLTRARTRRGINGNASEWLGAIDGLPAVHSRLRPVVIENMDALALIRREDGEGTLFYLDPPYLSYTRVTTDAYAHEMTVKQHEELLAIVKACKGKVMLSGYRSPLYEVELDGWQRHEFTIANHAAGGKSKRRMVECVWTNF